MQNCNRHIFCPQSPQLRTQCRWPTPEGRWDEWRSQIYGEEYHPPSKPAVRSTHAYTVKPHTQGTYTYTLTDINMRCTTVSSTQEENSISRRWVSAVILADSESCSNVESGRKLHADFAHHTHYRTLAFDTIIKYSCRKKQLQTWFIMGMLSQRALRYFFSSVMCEDWAW